MFEGFQGGFIRAPWWWEPPASRTAAIVVHSETYFPNSFQIERNTIVVTVFRLIMNPTDTVRWVPNQAVHGKYNLMWVWSDRIRSTFLRVFLPYKAKSSPQPNTDKLMCAPKSDFVYNSRLFPNYGNVQKAPFRRPWRPNAIWCDAKFYGHHYF